MAFCITVTPRCKPICDSVEESIPYPIINFLDSGGGEATYNANNNPICYVGTTCKLQITNHADIVSNGVKWYYMINGDDVTVDSEGFVTWVEKDNGAISRTMLFKFYTDKHYKSRSITVIPTLANYALVHHSWGGSGFVPYPKKQDFLLDGCQVYIPTNIYAYGSTSRLQNYIYLFDADVNVDLFFNSDYSNGFLSEKGYLENGCIDGRYCKDTTDMSNYFGVIGHLNNPNKCDAKVIHWNDIWDKPAMYTYRIPTIIKISLLTYEVLYYNHFTNATKYQSGTLRNPYDWNGHGYSIRINRPYCMNSIGVKVNGIWQSVYFESEGDGYCVVSVSNDGDYELFSPDPNSDIRVIEHNPNMDAWITDNGTNIN